VLGYRVRINKVRIYKYIRDANEIARLQKEFRQILKRNGEPIKTKVGHRGGTRDMEVLWFPSINVWIGSQKLKNRFWNALGVGKPQMRKSNSILCELNFPLRGVNRRIAGILAKDEKGRVWIGHRGRLGGAKHITIDNFKSWFRGKPMKVEGDDVVVVGNLSGGRIIFRIGSFVREVQRLTKQRHH